MSKCATCCDGSWLAFSQQHTYSSHLHSTIKLKTKLVLDTVPPHDPDSLERLIRRWRPTCSIMNTSGGKSGRYSYIDNDHRHISTCSTIKKFKSPRVNTRPQNWNETTSDSSRFTLDSVEATDPNSLYTGCAKKHSKLEKFENKVLVFNSDGSRQHKRHQRVSCCINFLGIQVQIHISHHYSVFRIEVSFFLFDQPPNVDMDFISQTLPNCSDGLFWFFQHLLPPCQLVNCNCGHDWKSHNHPCQWNNWICKVTQPFLRLPFKWSIFNFVYIGSRFPVEFQRARPFTEFILLWIHHYPASRGLVGPKNGSRQTIWTGDSHNCHIDSANSINC